MSSIIPKLYGAYRAAGYEPLTGYSPSHFFNFTDVQFTRFLHKGELVGIPGIALQEVMFIEHFRHYISPRRILIVGNSLGWSTIALALIFPKARTVAIDIDPTGVALTNALIAANALPARAVTARSPNDVAAVVREHLDGSLDFSFIDAVHTNEALTADFAAVKKVATENAIHLFHDVINWNMIDAFSQSLGKFSLQGKVFTRTASGMAMAYASLPEHFSNYLDCFADPHGLFGKQRYFYLETCVDPIPAFRNFDAQNIKRLGN